MTDATTGGALDRLLAVVVVLGRDAQHRLAEIGLSDARAGLLWELARSGPTTQRRLADLIGVSPRNITGLVDGLVGTGFVTREPHPDDRRAALVTLTAHGTAVVVTLAEEQRVFARQLFDGLPAASLRSFVDGLDHVLAVIAELGADSPHLAGLLPARPSAT